MKVFNSKGLSALCSAVKQVKEASDCNTSDVSAMRQDLQELAARLTDVLSEIGECIETLDTEKAYIDVRMAFALPVEGWSVNHNRTDYRYKYILSAAGITDKTRADAVIDSKSIPIVCACEMCPTTETIENGIVFLCNDIPEDTITGQLYLTRGTDNRTAEQNTESGGAI